MENFNRKIKILMWRHYLVRKHTYIATACELFISVVVFIYMYYDRYSFNGESIAEDAIHVPLNIPLSDIPGPSKIFYTPQNNETSALMEEVAFELNATVEPYSVENEDYPLSIINISGAIANETLDDPFKAKAFVEFMELSYSPRQLKYSVKMIGDEDRRWMWSPTYTRLNSNAGPLFKPALPLQWAIDKVYLRKITGENVTQELYLQEFPNTIVTPLAPNTETLRMYMVMANYCGLILPYYYTCAKLLQDRVSGVMELINIAGASRLMLVFSHFLDAMPACALFSIIGTLVLKLGNILVCSSGLLIFIILALHAVSVILTAMALTYLINNKQYGLTLAIISYTIIFPIIRSTEQKILGYDSTYIVGFFTPTAPFEWFLKEVNAAEFVEKGVTFTSMFVSHGDQTVAAIWALLALISQVVLYSLLVVYLTFVRPGPYGTAEPWNFLCKKEEEQKQIHSKKKLEENPLYFEDAPEGKDVGIKITNVTKVYDKKTALNHVTLDIYKGDITALIGHNGAGKTTLMSVITGITSPTAGEVQINGEKNTAEVRRREMGLCPQENVLLPSLTPKEHVIFYSMLKGESKQQAKKSSVVILDELQLLNKVNSNSDNLSGGMKRRLQLACALSGNPKVLILDEPTTGLDVESRRLLWNLLLKLRGSRTTLLSTHYMEEADTLGDRIAAISQGEIVGNATPIILKSNIGTGYILTISTSREPDEPEITRAITDSVPQATLNKSGPNFVTYNLPLQSSSQFPTMFKNLESERTKFGISTIGIGTSTLEEVFYKLCGEETSEKVKSPKASPQQSSKKDKVEDTLEEHKTFEENKDIEAEPAKPLKLISPPLLYLRQMMILFLRLLNYLKSTPWLYLVISKALPILIMSMVCQLVKSLKLVLKMPANSTIDSNPSSRRWYGEPFALDVPSLDDRPVYFDTDDTRSIDVLEQFSVKYKDTNFALSRNLSAGNENMNNETAVTYTNTIGGLYINTTTIQIFYFPHLYHTVGDAVNLASNAILNRVTRRSGGSGDGDFAAIITYNEDPLPLALNYKFFVALITVASFFMFFNYAIIFSMMISVNDLLKQEQQDSSRWLQIMAGCPVAVHWITRLIFDVCLQTLVLLIPLLFFIAVTKIITPEELLGQFGLVLFAGTLSWIPFVYLLSFISYANLILHLGTVIGIVLGIFDSLELIQTGVRQPLLSLMGFVTYVSWIVLPPHVATNGCMKTMYNSMYEEHANKTLVRKRDLSVARDVWHLLIQCLYHMIAVIFIEEGLCKLFNQLTKQGEKKRYSDENVIAEEEYVQKAIKNPNKDTDIMLVDNIHKVYWKMFIKPVRAVNGLTFSVKKGECFGLLGVNGAGKSTTFKVITAETNMSRGKIWVNGHFLKIPIGRYLKSLSYCPQFVGVDSFLTTKQNLKLFLTLRGLSDDDRKRETAVWLEAVGLKNQADVPVSLLSGGCQRRASTACALCSGAPLTLMDEPTAGVDVMARRRVWYTVRKALREGRAVVITSHSMDEMEALCGRVGIMNAGEMCALGSVPALRAQHAAGFSLQLKINTFLDNAEKNRMDQLKSDLNNTFNCTLTDDHQTVLYYHINENMPYSDLFTKLERLKDTYGGYIETYIVNETTLEEVFLSFAEKKIPSSKP